MLILYGGFDVSLEQTSVCVINAEGWPAPISDTTSGVIHFWLRAIGKSANPPDISGFRGLDHVRPEALNATQRPQSRWYRFSV
jgi:hypothetical protein